MTDPYTATPDRYDTMAYRRSGRSGLKLPAISLGLWQNFGTANPESTQREIVRHAFDHVGISPYRSSEVSCQPDMRKQVVYAA